MTLILSIFKECCITANFASLFGLVTNTSSQRHNEVPEPFPFFESRNEAKCGIDCSVQMHLASIEPEPMKLMGFILRSYVKESTNRHEWRRL